MAYSEKYFHIYCDKHGNTFRVSLQVWDYEGLATEVECGREQFVIERENSSEIKLGGVYGTRATATFISDTGFDLQELYTGDERSYLLVRLKNGNLNWQGNVVPDGFQQDNYDIARSQLTVKATDNLTTLKGKQFVDEVGDNFGDSDGEYMQSFLWVIKECLKKTGFIMPIWTMVDLQPLISIGSGETGVVLARRGHFNDWSPSEIGIFKEGVNFDFMQVGDTLIVSNSEFNNGTYTVTFIGNEVSYIKIHLSPQVPVQVHENVIINIISQNTDYVDPLYHTDHNIRVWINDSNIEGKTYYEARGGAMMTYDVLDAIARQYGAVIQQNSGHWEIKRWNADKVDDGVYEWFVYNSEGVEIGREDFGGDVLLPCVPTESAYRIFGSNLLMDRVLKYAIVNYRYKYNQEGDSLKNLIVNGNFTGSFDPYPRGWNKVHVDNVSSIPPMSIAKETSDLPPGFSEAIRIQNYADTRTLDNLSDLSDSAVNSGDRLQISWWEKIDGQTKDLCAVYSIAVYERLSDGYASSTPSGAPNSIRQRGLYHLALSGINSPREGARNTMQGRWVKYASDTGWTHFRFQAIYTERTQGAYGLWRKVTVEADDIPINGYLKFEVLGVANLSWAGGNAIKRVPVFKPDTSSNSFAQGYIGMVNPSDGVTLMTTGIAVLKLIDPDNEAVPQIDPFMYPDYQAQLTRRYSDTIPEVEVLTGDDYGEYAEDRISSMWWNGERTTMWDTWDNRFGWSRQGLVLAKSIMEMYWKPTRLLDCEISLPDLNWSSRIQFEEMPGKRFVILRGAIGGQYSTFRGTLTEIHDDADPALPPGGDDGGNTVDPNWQPTGVTRCVRDDDTGLNTGEVEAVEVDINLASPTYGQERWVISGTDTTMCPIGEPIDLYWGASITPIDHETLEYFPYQKDGNTYLVSFSNDGTGKHLVFLHRASLGTVTSIQYPGGGFEAYGNLPSWEYLSDVTINGYVYNVMRQIYPSGTFTGMELVFTIEL